MRQFGFRNVMVRAVMCNMVLENGVSLDMVQYTRDDIFHCVDIGPKLLN